MQGSEDAPKAPLGNNARPLQPLHHRTVRTNINFQNTQVSYLKNKFLEKKLFCLFMGSFFCYKLIKSNIYLISNYKMHLFWDI